MDVRLKLSLLILLVAAGCGPQAEAPRETALSLCLFAAEEIRPRDLSRIASAGGEVLGGCFANGASHLYFSASSSCSDLASENVNGGMAHIEEHLTRCSSLAVNSDPDLAQSFVLIDNTGTGLELHNLAGAGLLPVTYIDSYNNITCVEAPSENFVTVAKNFGLPTSTEHWVKKNQPCSVAALEYSGGFWPSRESSEEGMDQQKAAG